MARFGIFEKIYAHDYNQSSRVRQLEVVKLEGQVFFSYQNGKTYPLNHDKEVGYKIVGKTINSHFFDVESYTFKKDNKNYVLTPQSLVFSDCKFFLSHLVGDQELKNIESNFGFLFKESSPSIEKIKKCQDFFDKNYNKKFINEKYKSIFAKNGYYETRTPPQIGWYVIDFGKDQEK